MANPVNGSRDLDFNLEREDSGGELDVPIAKDPSDFAFTRRSEDGSKDVKLPPNGSTVCLRGFERRLNSCIATNWRGFSSRYITYWSLHFQSS